MSGFQDPEKLAAARELAQGFSKIKDPKKKKSGGGGGGGGGGGHQPRYEHWEPYPPQHHGHHAQFAPQQYWQDAGPPISSVPPPSQRMYASTTSFSTGRTGKVSVIGNAGLDFIKQAGIRPQGQAQPSQIPMTAQPLYAGFQPDIGSNGAADITHFASAFPQAAGGTAPGNILETFLAIAAKKPTLGQEIETLTEILPKAMDLNAPGATATNAYADKHMSHANLSQGQNGKVQGNGDGKANDANNTARTHDKQASQTRGSHSRKLSPVAAVFVPASNGALRQSTGANGETGFSAAQQTKGLSNSMWA